MLTQMHEEIIRQRTAALNRREVDIVCEVLVAMHPAQYFNALSKRYMDILRTNEEVGSIYKEKYHEYQRIIGNESQIVNMPMMKIPDSRDMEEDATLQSLLSLADGVKDEASEITFEDINNIESEDDIMIPDFIVNK